MKEKQEIGKSLLAGILIFALVLCNPICALAQSAKSNLLEEGTSVVLRVNEEVKTSNETEDGVINATVDNDIYSADSTKVLIAKGTPALIEFNVNPNGSWGKAGRVCLTSATTKTVDNKKVALRLSSCKNGGGKLGGVIALSVIFFPFGLISGCMKGGMPKIESGSTFDALITEDINCNTVVE